MSFLIFLFRTHTFINVAWHVRFVHCMTFFMLCVIISIVHFLCILVLVLAFPSTLHAYSKLFLPFVFNYIMLSLYLCKLLTPNDWNTMLPNTIEIPCCQTPLKYHATKPIHAQIAISHTTPCPHAWHDPWTNIRFSYGDSISVASTVDDSGGSQKGVYDLSMVNENFSPDETGLSSDSAYDLGGARGGGQRGDSLEVSPRSNASDLGEEKKKKRRKWKGLSDVIYKKWVSKWQQMIFKMLYFCLLCKSRSIIIIFRFYIAFNTSTMSLSDFQL